MVSAASNTFASSTDGIYSTVSGKFNNAVLFSNLLCSDLQEDRAIKNIIRIKNAFPFKESYLAYFLYVINLSTYFYNF